VVNIHKEIRRRMHTAQGSVMHNATASMPSCSHFSHLPDTATLPTADTKQGSEVGFRPVQRRSVSAERRNREALQRLTSDDWDFWTPVILAEHSGPGDDATRNVLLSEACEHSKAAFLSTLSDLIKAQQAADFLTARAAERVVVQAVAA
jgi:hypothetical protein